MKRLVKKEGGFTLIEIIVVLIILGVLAAIALPNLFGNINRSRGAEALASLSPAKAQVDGCLGARGYGDATSCVIVLASSPNFSAYTITTGAGVSIAATTTLGAGGTITLTRTNLASTGTWSCTGTGVMAGIC